MADPVAADAFVRGGEESAALYARASEAERRFRRGSVGFGVWFGLVGGVFVAAYSRRKVRGIFETDSSDCVACGRCFAACPREQVRIREAREEQDHGKRS